jgi:thiosulfate/3-mercaptopyruvate sulfurtransferase
MLIEPAEVQKDKMILIDCSSKDGYRRAHIPGAVHLPREPMGDLPPGVFPMPLMPGQFLKDTNAPNKIISPDSFEELARSMGVNNDSHVVVYCDNAMLFSSRVWWAFKYHGLEKVSLLNGGWNNWVTSGHVSVKNEKPVKGTFTAELQTNRFATTDQVLDAVKKQDI